VNLPVLVLAGGLGTRISKKYNRTQKCMIHFNKKPFLHYVLKNLEKNNVKKVILLVGYKSYQVVKFINNNKNNYKLDINFSFDGKKLLGTGGSVKKALGLIKKNFLLTYADSYLDYNFKKIIKYYSNKKIPNLIFVYKNKKGSDASNIRIKNKKVIYYDKIKNLGCDYIDWGISILDKKEFKNIKKSSFDMSAIYKKLVRKKKLYSYRVYKTYREINNPSSLRSFKKFLNEKK